MKTATYTEVDARGISRRDKNLIWQAVEAVVTEYHPEPHRACALYAYLGAAAIARKTGIRCGFCAGSFRVVVGRDAEGYLCDIEFDANNPLNQLYPLEYHCWLFMPTADRDGVTHLIDFAAAHYPTWAAAYGIEWGRRDIQGYVWAEVEALPELKIWCEPKEELTRAIYADFVEDPATEAMVYRVFEKLEAFS